MLTEVQIRDIAAVYSKDPHYFEFEANDFIAAARAIEQASRTAALEEAIGNIHALRASHIADAPTCDYVSCDFVSAWDDAVAAIRALAKPDGESV